MDKSYDNIRDINIDIDNYKNFKDCLIKFLNLNPMIKYYDFRKEAYNIYNNNKCSFKIESKTFSNIYYTWRKN